MSCQGNNATPPGPAFAPGADAIDPAAAALDAAKSGVDPRVRAVVPGFDAPFLQAGLAGYSDAAMRIIARRHGCPFCVTEALLDRLLLAGGRGFDKADLQALADSVPGGDEDFPIAGQIIGSDPDEMAAAALKMMEQGRRAAKDYRLLAYGQRALPRATELGNRAGSRALPTAFPVPCSLSPAPVSFTTIDVNLACPVKKIKAKARGGHWLAEPEGAIEILRAVRAAVPRQTPCTVKLRRSYDETPEMARNFLRIFEAAYELGYAWATVHARTVEQKYVGPSRWPALRDLCSAYPDRVIFGSGDVWEAADIFRMLAYTGVCAVSVARGCIGNPWIFRQARELMAGRAASPPTVSEQRSVLEDHFRLSVAINGEHHAGRLMRKFGVRFAAHHPMAEHVRRGFIGVESLEDWCTVLDRFYANPVDALQPA